MEEDKERLDENDRHIIDIVAGNPDCTINFVRDEMSKNHWLSSAPTDKKVKRLIGLGEINDNKVGNSQHKLRVNDKKEYQRVVKSLSKIDTFIDLFNDPISALNQMGTQQPFYIQAQAYHGKELFIFPYIEMLATMLRVLYMKETGISKVDSEALHSRNIKLFKKLTLQTIAMKNENQVLANCRKRFQEALDHISSNPGLYGEIFNPILLQNIIKMSEEFERDYLA